MFTNDRNDIVSGNCWNSKLLIPSELEDLVKDISPTNSINMNLVEYYDDNNLIGTIELEDKQILFLSIPYSDGWQIKDNGNIIDKYKVQGGFIGLVLESGYHYLEFNFMPPGLKLGVITSCIGLVALIIIFTIEKRKNVLLFKL